MEINTKELFNRKRLDLIVKYLYAKEIFEKPDNLYSKDIYKDLYIRHILMRNGGVTSHLETLQKRCVDDYCKEFEKLICNMREKGFDKNFPVEITTGGLISNGAHRIATAMALGINTEAIIKDDGFSWGFDWFNDNGFNIEDKQRILKGYVDLKSQNSILFVVWNPLIQYADNIKTVINKYFDVVGDIELDFEDNYIAFINSLLEIYERNIAQNNHDESGILAKAKLLLSNQLSYKVIVATNENKNADISIENLSKDCKCEIRNLFDHILPKEIFCTVHSSDGVEETQYLSNILLSPNNIKYLRMRMDYKTDERLTSLIRKLPDYLKTINIPTQDICVIGTGVLSAIGIQRHHDSDIDFIIDHKHRNKFGWGAYHLNDDYEIGVSSKQAQGPILDDIIIHNDDYHFWFKGIKFANLDIIKDRKKSNSRPKDAFHLRQIELFEKLQGHFNQQQILLKRIAAEKQRRCECHKNKIINTKLYYSNIFERILSFKNEYSNNKKYKVITLCNIRIKLRGKNAK